MSLMYAKILRQSSYAFAFIMGFLKCAKKTKRISLSPPNKEEIKLMLDGLYVMNAYGDLTQIWYVRFQRGDFLQQKIIPFGQGSMEICTLVLKQLLRYSNSTLFDLLTCYLNIC